VLVGVLVSVRAVAVVADAVRVVAAGLRDESQERLRRVLDAVRPPAPLREQQRKQDEREKASPAMRASRAARAPDRARQ